MEGALTEGLADVQNGGIVLEHVNFINVLEWLNTCHQRELAGPDESYRIS